MKTKCQLPEIIDQLITVSKDPYMLC